MTARQLELELVRFLLKNYNYAGPKAPISLHILGLSNVHYHFLIITH